MRYRIFEDKFLCHFEDRSSFDESFSGRDPNNPKNGLLKILDQYYVIIYYQEYASQYFTENEFHETEQDWFAKVGVVRML